MNKSKSITMINSTPVLSPTPLRVSKNKIRDSDSEKKKITPNSKSRMHKHRKYSTKPEKTSRERTQTSISYIQEFKEIQNEVKKSLRTTKSKRSKKSLEPVTEKK